MKKFIHSLADKPVVFNILRSIIEANYVSIKKVIKKEFSLSNISIKENILDIPCGTGEFCMLFTPESYYGLDISDKYIDYAKNKYKRRFVCGDAKESGFDDGYFDKILTIGFLHHLDDPSVISVLKEAKRILKPDGTLLLIEDAPTKSKWNFIGKHIQKFDVGSNIRLGSEYRTVLENNFNIRRSYHIQSGFWDYSVFSLSPKR